MWKAILAAMLFLQAPGRSIYSQVVVPENAPAPCADPYSLLCSPPRWSEDHAGFTVVESWGQGLNRYAVIAHAADIVVFHTKRSSPRDHLWRYLLAFAYHESGFRRDVHEGVGQAARGDCAWRTVEVGGKKRRTRVPGSCKSHCLAQIMIGPVDSAAKINGYGPRELTGLDLDSTVRCLDVATTIIDRAYQFCAKRGPRPLSLCIVTHYAGGMIASNDKRVIARVKTMNKLLHAPTALGRDAELALGAGPSSMGNGAASP
jgi:hypothetical protein